MSTCSRNNSSRSIDSGWDRADSPHGWRCWPYSQLRRACRERRQSATAFKQAHMPIRKAMEEHRGLSEFTYEVFLQGSYKNGTNLGGDSDIDVVIRLAHDLNPGVAALTGAELQRADLHKAAHRQWRLFRRNALRAMRSRFGDEASGGRKTLKIRKG